MSNQYYILQMSGCANGRAATDPALRTALAQGEAPSPYRPAIGNLGPPLLSARSPVAHYTLAPVYSNPKRAHNMLRKEKMALPRTALSTAHNPHTSVM